MTDSDALALAHWLLEAGAGQSARAVLGGIRGPEANRLRARASAAAPRPGFYALGVTPGGEGVAVPLVVTPGASRATDPLFRAASERALRAAREALSAPTLPALRLGLEDTLGSFGESLGLGAALAFVAHASGRAPAVPVFVTGALRDDGSVAPVDALEAKVRAAAREIRDAAALVLVPRGTDIPAGAPAPIAVGHLRDALALALGGGALGVRPDLVALDALFERARSLRDPERAIALLEGVPTERASAADRARLALELGMHHRHAGRTSDAARLHAEGIALLADTRRVLGASLAETYELQAWSTRLDQFDVEPTIAAISERLTRPFVHLHNEVRARGILAQALSTAGRAREALAVRTPSLELQSESDALRRELPWTYCALCADAARAGLGTEFERYAERLCALTPRGDLAQWRFNAAALVRGLDRLGRHREALAWLRDERALHGAPVPAAAARVLSGGDIVREYPEVSLARAAASALRREGDATAALDLAARVQRPIASGAADLAAWVALLASLESVLALDALGRAQEAARVFATAREKLRQAHTAASAFHTVLFACEIPGLERALDAVWY